MNPIPGPAEAIKTALLAAIQQVRDDTGLSLQRFGVEAVNDKHLIPRIAAGQITLRKIERVGEYCAKRGRPVIFDNRAISTVQAA